MRDVAEKAKVKWERVLAADALPGSDDWNKMMVLVRRAAPQVERAIVAAGRGEDDVRSWFLVLGSSPEARNADNREQRTKNEEPKIVLMLFPGLLARYEQMDLLTRVREKIGRPGGIPGLWMLIPADAQSLLPVVDDKPVPVIGPAEWARVPEAWFTNRHRS